jgi:carbonic anhydrase/acetyltransferase-like protein (isoleucine patch superfamily)
MRKDFYSFVQIKGILMALIKEVRGLAPVFGNDCFLTENSVVIGDVLMGDQCSVWFHAVVRGDVNAIRIGNKVNIQDGAIIHCTYETASTTIGNRVSIGHRALVHGCTLEDNVLIGMGAIVMDHALVQTGSIVAAGAVVLENSVIESGWIWAGVPAKPVKKVSEALLKGQIDRIADNYLMYSEWLK